jgi:hypothetical protein
MGEQAVAVTGPELAMAETEQLILVQVEAEGLMGSMVALAVPVS